MPENSDMDVCEKRDRISSTTDFRYFLSPDQLENHLIDVGNYFRNLWINNPETGSDGVILLADETRLKIHLFLLASHSKYFSEKIIKNEKIINGTYFAPSAVRRAISFIYTGNLEYKLSEFPDFFFIANFWKFDRFKKFLEKRLESESDHPSLMIHCANITRCRRAQISDSTVRNIVKKASLNLRDLFRDLRITNLNFKVVKKILDEDAAKCDGEAEIAEHVITYLKPDQNRKFAEDLIQVIRHEHLNPNEKFLIIENAKHQLGNEYGRMFENHFSGSSSGKLQRPIEEHSDAYSCGNSRKLKMNSMEDFLKNKSPNPYIQKDRSQMRTGPHDFSTDSLHELKDLPDMFREKILEPVSNYRIQNELSGYVDASAFPESINNVDEALDPFIEASHEKTINKKMYSENSFREINRLPDVNDEIGYELKSSPSSSDLSLKTAISSPILPESSLQRRFSRSCLHDLNAHPSWNQINITDIPKKEITTVKSFKESIFYETMDSGSPSKDVETCRSFGELTFHQATEGVHGQLPSGNVPLSGQSPHPQNSPEQNPYSIVGNSSEIPFSYLRKTSDTNINRNQKRLNDIQSSQSIADINNVPDVFSNSVHNPGITFDQIVPPSDSSTELNTAHSM